MISIFLCSQLTREHRTKPRVYAHVFHYPNKICVTREFEDLPQRFRTGILLHECGHLVFNEKTQGRADETIHQVFRIRILRRTWNGVPNLECVDERMLPFARDILLLMFRYGGGLWRRGR